MITIKASCPMCGEVELAPANIRLMVCDKPSLSYYAFDCPTCADEVRKPADKGIISLLKSSNVPETIFEVPAEALELKLGPQLTPDEVLDFALALDNLDSEDDIVSLAAKKVIEL